MEKEDFNMFDVAVSFNGKDRSIVEEKVREMTQAGIRVFYDFNDHKDTTHSTVMRVIEHAQKAV